MPAAAAFAPSPTPPKDRSFFARHRRKFISALILAVVFDVGAYLLRVSTPFLKAANAAMAYGLDSVNVVRFGGDMIERLGDRYHFLVWSLAEPFNLTTVCREQRGPEFGATVAARCVTRGRPEAAPGVPEELVKQLPIRPLNTVDEWMYPRRAWLEIPMGLPDAAIYAVRCSWNGADACPAGQTAQPRTNYLGRTMLVVIAVLALFAASPTRQTGWSPARFLAAFVLGLVTWGVLAYVVLLVFGLISWLSAGVLQLTQMIVAVTAIRPLAWVMHAVKDVAADRAKGAIETRV